jgi:hypothetical protein
MSSITLAQLKQVRRLPHLGTNGHKKSNFDML